MSGTRSLPFHRARGHRPQTTVCRPHPSPLGGCEPLFHTVRAGLVSTSQMAARPSSAAMPLIRCCWSRP
jgi:hypothetical protein